MADTQFTIYHNPKCSKSRNTLALLQQHGIEPVVIDYLKEVPSKSELKAIVKKLGFQPEQIVRKGEDAYKSKFAGKTLSDDQWLDALVGNPILIERPIVVKGDRAVVGRPPENALDLI
jgi:arsenate reductase